MDDDQAFVANYLCQAVVKAQDDAGKALVERKQEQLRAEYRAALTKIQGQPWKAEAIRQEFREKGLDFTRPV